MHEAVVLVDMRQKEGDAVQSCCVVIARTGEEEINVK